LEKKNLKRRLERKFRVLYPTQISLADFDGKISFSSRGKKREVFQTNDSFLTIPHRTFTHTQTPICLFSREDGANTAPRWTATRIFSLFLFFSVSVEEVKEEHQRWRRRCAFYFL
jgi:hypothetical protein